MITRQRVTNPRRIPMPKTTFAVCRRDRRFLLRPDEKLTALVTWLFVEHLGLPADRVAPAPARAPPEPLELDWGA